MSTAQGPGPPGAACSFPLCQLPPPSFTLKTEVEFTCTKTPTVPNCDSVAFSTFTRLCNHHLCPVPERSITSTGSSIPVSSHPHPFSSPGNANPLSPSPDIARGGGHVQDGRRPGPLRTRQLLARSSEAGRVAGHPGVLAPGLWQQSSCRGGTTAPTPAPRHRRRLVETLSGLWMRWWGRHPHAVPAKGRRRPELWAALSLPPACRPCAGLRDAEGGGLTAVPVLWGFRPRGQRKSEQRGKGAGGRLRGDRSLDTGRAGHK